MLAVSLFSGCGGMDFGIERAGFDIAFANDFDKHACRTLELNGGRNVAYAPIEEVSSSDIKKTAGSQRNSIDLLFGGPPCQPFSKSGYWVNGDTRRLDDHRADTLTHYFRMVEELLPRAFLLENVHGINYSGKEEGFQYILKRIEEINSSTGSKYVPEWQVINTADYGVPQSRVRFFLVAIRNGKRFEFPRPSHAATAEDTRTLFDSPAASHTTCWEAIGHLKPDADENLKVGGRWGELLPSIPEGENYLWHTDRRGGLPLFGWRTRYWSFLLKLAKDRPSWTLQAQPGSAIGPFHWENRKLSWREMAAIQTFPKTFVIDSPRVEIQRQIGNAVPSLMAEILGRSIAEQLIGKTSEAPYSLSVVRLPSLPPSEPVSKVPKTYRSLIGEHIAHPGTGKGRAYQKSIVGEKNSTIGPKSA